MIVCAGCAAPLPLGKQRWCSDKCKFAHRTKRLTGARRREILCPTCGTPFISKQGKKYCSPKCNKPRQKDSGRRQMKVVAICRYCQAEFHPRYSSPAKFCSPRCFNDHLHDCKLVRQVRMEAERQAKRPTCEVCGTKLHHWHASHCEECHEKAKARQCLTCGDAYRPKQGRRRQACDSCNVQPAKDAAKIKRKQWNNLHGPEKRKRWRKKQRALGLDFRGKHKRRAKRLGLEYETVHPRTVFERDNWVCGICGDPLDREAEVPDRLAPTLDHIIPMSKGGPHTYDNVQAAHFLCNYTKSDQILPPQKLDGNVLNVES